MWQPSGDTLVLEKVKNTDSQVILPDGVDFDAQDVFRVKAVGIGYTTEQGTVVPPEQKPGDCVIIGKASRILRLSIEGKEILLARAQDVLLFKKGERDAS